jgi:hypothetical protein
MRQLPLPSTRFFLLRWRASGRGLHDRARGSQAGPTAQRSAVAYSPRLTRQIPRPSHPAVSNADLHSAGDAAFPAVRRTGPHTFLVANYTSPLSDPDRTWIVGQTSASTCCIMTSYDPDTLIQDKEITRSIYRRFGGKLALNCFVVEGGDIAVGDEVRLARGRACADSAAFIE